MLSVLAFSLLQAHADPISEGLSGLRKMEPAARAQATDQLALDIRKMPAGPKKLSYASALSNLATEGDCGEKGLQDVTDTLVLALTEAPPKNPAPYYSTLANFARYEGMHVRLNNAEYRTAMSTLAAREAAQAKVDFTLTDLNGTTWTRSALKGKVVVVNFWATWCPPCRAEMPDLEKLYKELAPKGLVVLAISDEKRDVVTKFLADKSYTFPILLDSDRAVNTKYLIEGIPNSFVYNREGKLAAVGIDGRTRRQFLKLLAKAGLRP